jgi:ABC-type Zn uptake system ZnuABC Zn-binding protein ZnuA
MDPTTERYGVSMARSLTPTIMAVFAMVLIACGGAADDPATDPDVRDASDPSSDDVASEQPGTVGDDASGDDDGFVLAVVATVAPIADLVAMVGGERVEVDSLVPAGADAHTYEPRPQDVVALSDADAYLGVGLGLNDGALRLARENLPEGAPLVLLGEDLLNDQDLVFDHSHDDDHSHGDEDQGHSHGDEDQGHSHGDEDQGHSHGDDQLGPNPHVWTSVRNAATMVDGIATTLSDLDPDGAEQYAANAAAYRDQLDDLDGRIASAVTTIPEDNRVLVTYHDAWSYFARDHELSFATAIQPADYSEPSAGELRALIDQIRALGVPTVFGSEVFPTPVLETIAEESDAAYVGDLSDDVLPGDPGDPEHSYLEMMRRNAHVIVTGLGGDASSLG